MSTQHPHGADTPVNATPARLTIAWALEGLPLAYGVYQTLTVVTRLFG